jgi:hypothetical protein
VDEPASGRTPGGMALRDWKPGSQGSLRWKAASPDALNHLTVPDWDRSMAFATFVVRTEASHLAITDRIDTPYNTKSRSMHPDGNSRPVRGSNNSRGHGRGRRPLFHRSPYQQLLRVRDRHPNHPNRLATPELVMVSPRQ